MLANALLLLCVGWLAGWLASFFVFLLLLLLLLLPLLLLLTLFHLPLIGHGFFYLFVSVA